MKMPGLLLAYWNVTTYVTMNYLPKLKYASLIGRERQPRINTTFEYRGIIVSVQETDHAALFDPRQAADSPRIIKSNHVTTPQTNKLPPEPKTKNTMPPPHAPPSSFNCGHCLSHPHVPPYISTRLPSYPHTDTRPFPSCGAGNSPRTTDHCIVYSCDSHPSPIHCSYNRPIPAF